MKQFFLQKIEIALSNEQIVKHFYKTCVRKSLVEFYFLYSTNVGGVMLLNFVHKNLLFTKTHLANTKNYIF